MKTEQLDGGDFDITDESRRELDSLLDKAGVTDSLSMEKAKEQIQKMGEDPSYGEDQQPESTPPVQNDASVESIDQDVDMFKNLPIPTEKTPTPKKEEVPPSETTPVKEETSKEETKSEKGTPPSSEELKNLPEKVDLLDDLLKDSSTKTEAKKTEAGSSEEKDEVDAIPEPRNMPPAQKANWANLREEAKKRGAKVKELTAQLEEANKRSQEPPEALVKENQELRAFRRKFDIQHDPEFKQKYDDKIQQSRDAAIAVLKKYGATDEYLEGLKQLGGVENMDPIILRDEVLSKLEAGGLEQRKDAIVLKQAIDSTLSLLVGKEQEISEASKEGSAYLKEKETKHAEYVKNYNKAVEDTIVAVQSKVPWAKEREVPSNASPEEKERILRDNQYYKEKVEPVFAKAIFDTSPQSRVQVAMAAVMAYRLSEENNLLRAKYNNLAQTYNKLRAAGSTRPADVKVPMESSTSSTSDLLNMSDDDAIEAGLKTLGI